MIPPGVLRSFRMANPSALHRERRRLFRRILAISAVVGAVYGLSVSTRESMPVSLVIGILNGVVVAACIAGTEIFLLRRPAALRALARLPFAAVVLLKTVAYGGVVSLYGLLLAGTARHLLVQSGMFSPRTSLPAAVGFALGITALFVLVLQATALVGRRTFRDLLLGRYRRPRAERRFFLFVDVVGSTALAERLGPLKAHEFLATVFSLAAEPIAAAQGEIYQYVGDEIVVTWTEAEGRAGARPLHCYFDLQETLAAQAPDFQARFGVAPALRAALHLGDVIAGEVGEQRRAIVFHGDVMNTASRLEQATRELDARFIASAEALGALEGADAFALRDLGALQLRGRQAPVRARAVDRRGAP